MSSLFYFLPQVFLSLLTWSTLGNMKEPIVCEFRWYPNDTVLCKGYSSENRNCTNAKECCRHTTFGCMNMSMIEAYGMWELPPTLPKIPPSCSRNDYVISQENNTNKAVEGHVIERHDVVSITECGDLCLRQPECRSFNVAHVGNKKEKKACELLEEDQNIVQRQGFSFWLFDRDSYTEAFLSPRCNTDKLP